ncbi:MAG: hypothetical protein R6W06_04275 [Prochlorococcaceae cyanobacterium]
MSRLRPFALLAASTSLALVALGPVGAQEALPFSLMRATNVARMRAEKLNGGLTVYRTASCMYARGGGECLVNTSEQGFTFRFLGGPPGWQQLELQPTLETEIEVSSDGREVLSVLYNGAPR